MRCGFGCRALNVKLRPPLLAHEVRAGQVSLGSLAPLAQSDGRGRRTFRRKHTLGHAQAIPDRGLERKADPLACVTPLARAVLGAVSGLMPYDCRRIALSLD